MLPYSPKHGSPFNSEEYKNTLNPNAYRALKQLTKILSPSTLRPFYDCSSDKDDVLISPEQARERSFTLAIKIICRMLTLVYLKKGLRKSDRKKLLKLLTQSVSRRASDVELRVQLTYSFIKHLYAIRRKTIKDKSTEFYLLTFSCDSWCSSEYAPVVDLYQAKEDVLALLRRYGFCDALGVFEIQPLLNDPLRRREGVTFMLHCHVVIWRQEWSKSDIKKFRIKVEKRLCNKRLKSPLHVTRIERSKNDILRIASYLPKLPGYAKRWKSETELINGEKALSRKRILRLLEILSYIPQKSLIFGVGQEGNALKRDIWGDVTTWNRKRIKHFDGETISYAELKALWKRVWHVIDPKYTKAPVILLRRGEKDAS